MDELQIFRNIDNTENEILARYFEGESINLAVNYTDIIDEESMRNGLTKYEWLTEWRSLYLMVLRMIFVDQQRKLTNTEKLKDFVQWMFYEFRLSLVTIVFAISLFSSTRFKNMIKYKPAASKETKIKQLKNMTWDLYLMNSFMRLWQNKKANHEYLFASDDSVIKEVLRRAIEVQKSGGFDVLNKYLRNNELDLLEFINRIITSKEERVYSSDSWTPEYRDHLIGNYEKLILTA